LPIGTAAGGCVVSDAIGRYESIARRICSCDEEARAVLLRQEDYILIESLLYQIFTSHSPKAQSASAQLVIPPNLKNFFLQLHHDNEMGAHLGTARMLSIMRPRYYFG